MLEDTENVPAMIVLEVVNLTLLEICLKYDQYVTSASSACTYFLNTYMHIINKMLGLGAKHRERCVVLKVLTTIVTYFPKLAKDILRDVKFFKENIAKLTEPSEIKDSTRGAFINFLVSFLIDGHYPVISLILENHSLLTSIVEGLISDTADRVCLVLITFRKYVVENPQISKTIKMKVFNTTVIKNVVNLYNWKNHGQSAEDNSEESKNRVNECVHSLLLVLCTSHKHGVVFSDHLIGLEKKSHNILMYTVLESLERPWEHKYASELVVKICGACPDLTKIVWSNLKPYLNPRLSKKWLNAIKFASRLVNELDLTCLNPYLKDLTVTQVLYVLLHFTVTFVSKECMVLNC